jgi:hypothetical protein
MSHLAVLASAVVVLTNAAAAIQAVAARDAGEGVVWVVTRGTTSQALPSLLRQDNVRMVNAWAGGRLLQLHVGSLRNFTRPPGATWLLMRQPRSSPVWPGCG